MMGVISRYLQAAAKQEPEAPLFSFLTYPGSPRSSASPISDEPEETIWTRGQLDAYARAIAAELLHRGLRGRRVLLLFVPGLEFIAALYGCLYAGAIAVPAYPPDPTRPDRLARTLPRLLSIVQDSAPELVLTSSLILSMTSFLFDHAKSLSELPWAASDEWQKGDPDFYVAPSLSGEDLALIQYTSGSTSAPKGVMIGHDNLIANLHQLNSVRRGGKDTRFVVWPPFYHDLGLIGGIMLPVFLGGRSFLLSPMDFLRRPARWLEAISRYRADLSAGPNFALDLCVRKLTKEELSRLDLSCWTMNLVGAEPIHLDTLQRFQDLLAPCGLPPNMLVQAYGLAEAVLGCTAGSGDEPYRYLHVDAAALRDRVVRLDPTGRPIVSCGAPLVDQRVEIVDPEHLLRSPNGRIGEVWLSGPNVARGYWQRAEENARTFGAELPGCPGVRFLRTGDLGFLHEGDLYLTGRIKDLIIIRGKNHHPEDLERTIERSHESVRASCCAAFAIEGEGTERLVVVAEVGPEAARDPALLGAIALRIRGEISVRHEVLAHTIVLIGAGQIPKTSSGKIMRHGCRREFLDGKLQELLRSVAPDLSDAIPGGVLFVETGANASPLAPPSAPLLPAPGSDAAAYTAWLCAALLPRLGAASIPGASELSFSQLGLDSRQAVELTVELERHLGRRLPATLLFDHPNIRALGRYLGTSSPATGIFPAVRAAPMARTTTGSKEPIAIIGIGCRFPGGASSPEGFWRLLEEGRDGITEVPRERWDMDAFYDPSPSAAGKSYSKWGGFLPDIEKADAHFLGLRSVELRGLDPQGRLLMEVAWEALEDAGIVPARLAGSQTGVYVGLCGNDYLLRATGNPQTLSAHSVLGSLHSTIAGRLSYWLGLMGPNMPIDTACSSSLVALHLACQGLRQGDCDLALCGGANVVLAVEGLIAFSRLRALSPTGRCRTFSSDADGFVRAEGCGVLVLKRLSDARRDGDRVLALVRGSAVNQDGRTNGLSAPSRAAQEAVIRRALENAGVAPNDVDYVECHGTGTVLGDPIEVQALSAVLGQGRESARKVVLGAVKSNIGHAEAAAGVAGVIKTVLAMRHGRIPANLHFRGQNPHVPWEQLPVQLATKALDWPGAGPRRAGVSSFGISGTNAHVILEGVDDPKDVKEAGIQRGANPEKTLPFLISGRTNAALFAQAALLRDHLLARPELALGDVAYSLATTRTHFAKRAVLLCNTREELLRTLGALAQGIVEPPQLAGGALLEAVDQHLRGEEVPWTEHLLGHRVDLPTYAFQRERAWLDKT